MDACAQGSRGEFPTQRAAFLASVRDSIAQEAASVVRDAVALEQAARKVASRG